MIPMYKHSDDCNAKLSRSLDFDNLSWGKTADGLREICAIAISRNKE